MKALLLLVLFVCICSPVYAAEHEQYSETIQALLRRLGSAAETEGKPVQLPGVVETEGEPTEPPADETGPQSPPATEKQGDTRPLRERFEGSILERIQREGTASPEDVVGSIDQVSTSIYNSITRMIIGFAPVLLIIAAVMVMFSKGKAAGVILLMGVGLIAIFNAPEIMRAFLQFISSLFN